MPATTLTDLAPVIRRQAVLHASRTGGRVQADDLYQVGMMAAHLFLLQRDQRDGADIVNRAACRARGAMIDQARAETHYHPAASERRLRAIKPVPLDESVIREYPDPGPGPEEQVMRRQMARAVLDAMQRLPERLRRVLSLTYESEATQTEIAAIWGIDRSRVSQLHSEAICMLRTDLAPAGAATA